MAALTFELLDSWVDEFKTLNLEVSDGTKVIVQDGDGGRDTGLIGVTLEHATTAAFLQLDSGDPARWVATFEARDTPMVQDAAELLELSKEIATIAALCAFLQAKSNDVPEAAAA